MNLIIKEVIKIPYKFKKVIILIDFLQLIWYNFLKGEVFMYREIINDLIEWKESKTRKPLIIHGARQVGKTCRQSFALKQGRS